MAGFTLQPTSLPPNNSSENKLLSTFIHSESGHTQQVALGCNHGTVGSAMQNAWKLVVA